MKKLEDIKYTPYESRPPRQKKQPRHRAAWATIHKGRDPKNSVGMYGLPQFVGASHFLPAWGEAEDGRINAIELTFLAEEKPKAMKIRRVKNRKPYIDCPCPDGFAARWRRGSEKWGAITETRIVDGRVLIRIPANIIITGVVKRGGTVEGGGLPAEERKLREREDRGLEDRYVYSNDEVMS